MSSYNSLSGVPLQFNSDFVAEQGVQSLLGSFQGNTTSSPLQAQNRGSWFTVTRTGTGTFLVQLVGIKPNNAIVPVQAQGNGQPNGLLGETTAWVVGETINTVVTTAVTAAVAAKYDNVNNQFTIFTLAPAGTPADPPATTRIFFNLVWKVVPILP